MRSGVRLLSKTGTTGADPSKDSEEDNPLGSIGDFSSFPKTRNVKENEFYKLKLVFHHDWKSRRSRSLGILSAGRCGGRIRDPR